MNPSKIKSRPWHVIDAQGQILGRLATRVAGLLTGKSKVTYQPHQDGGDFVIVINAEGIKITGNNKPIQKMDFRHSGYPGGDTLIPYIKLLATKPEKAIKLAVSGMLPKNKLRSRRIVRLKVFKGSQHPHGAQVKSGDTNKNIEAKG